MIEAVTEGNIPLEIGAALAYGIVTFYVMKSGVMAVGWTNTFQGVFMITIAWILGLYLPTHFYGGVGQMFDSIASARPGFLTVPGLDGNGEPWTWAGYSSAVLVSLIGVQMWPHLFMKAFTAKNNDIIRKTTILFPTFWLFLIPVFLIGFAGVLFPEKPPTSDFVLPFMIMQTDLPPLIVGLFCAGALSASMSTGDALLHGSASVVEEDAVRLFVKLDDKQAQTLMRFLIVIVGVASYLLALGDHSSLVDLLLASYGIICQLAPTVLAAIYWKRATTIGILAGLTSGGFVTTILSFNSVMMAHPQGDLEHLATRSVSVIDSYGLVPLH